MSDRVARLPGVEGLRASWVPRALGILAFFAAWTALASIFPEDLMPYPIATFEEVWLLVASGSALPHLEATIFRTVVGFVGALSVGVAAGVAMGANDFLRKFLTPYIILGLAMPALVWAALSTLTLGYNNSTIFLATVLTVFPFIALPIWKAVENIEYDLILMAKSFEVSNARIVRRLVMPSVLPAFASTVRLAIATSWNIVVVGELVAANNGVGEQLVYSYSIYQYDKAWAWAALFMLIILVVEYGILKPLERRAFQYRVDADYQFF